MSSEKRPPLPALRTERVAASLRASSSLLCRGIFISHPFLAWSPGLYPWPLCLGPWIWFLLSRVCRFMVLFIPTCSCPLLSLEDQGVIIIHWVARVHSTPVLLPQISPSSSLFSTLAFLFEVSLTFTNFYYIAGDAKNINTCWELLKIPLQSSSRFPWPLQM